METALRTATEESDTLALTLLLEHGAPVTGDIFAAACESGSAVDILQAFF